MVWSLERGVFMGRALPARLRNGDGFLPHQLALEHGHRALAETLASRAGKALPMKTPRSKLQTCLLYTSPSPRDRG